MKKIIAISMLLIISTAAFSQQTNSSLVLTKQDYLLKSKHQHTAATILLVGGVSCALIAPFLWYVTPKNYDGFNFFQVLFIAGLISVPASIPLFIAAHRNKKKSISLSFKNETAPLLQNKSFISRSVPSLALKINL